MKKFLLYTLLALLAYLIFMVVRFPAAPVVSRLELRPLVVSGVSGPLWKGNVAAVEAPNDALPTGPDTFLLEDVSWQLAPMALLSGKGAANIRFYAYGGTGEGQVAQGLAGDTVVSDFSYVSNGRSLNILLEPLASISGEFSLQVDELILENQLLNTMQGRVVWQNAGLLEPTPAKLGNVSIDIRPEGDSHIAAVSATGGDLEIDGTVDVEKNGNYKTDITIRPKPGAPRELTDMLRALGRPASDGSFRVRRSGNANRMM